MTAPEIEFASLYGLITRMIAESSDAADPREIAVAVAERIPNDLRMQILTTALVPQIKSVLAKQRNQAFDNVTNPRPIAPSRPQPRFGGTPRFGGSFTPPPAAPSSIQAERLAPASRSAKVEGIRDWWAEMLRSKVHVGETRWLPLGQCGVKELEFAERERRDQADKAIRRARMYLALRQLLDEHQVETVADLPAEAARAVAA